MEISRHIGNIIISMIWVVPGKQTFIKVKKWNSANTQSRFKAKNKLLWNILEKDTLFKEIFT